MATSGSTTQSSGGPGGNACIDLRLQRRSGAVGEARSAVRRRLGGLIAKDLLEDLLVVVSELVTNAVLYGQGEVGLRLIFDPDGIRGEVGDEGPGFSHEPQAREPGRVGGNGLFMVSRIADRWGLRDAPARVWFEILTPAPG